MNKKALWVIIVVLLLALIGGGYYLMTQKTKQTQAKRFQGINIVFFPGGSETDPFASVVYNGAKAAEEDFGPNVKYMWSGWNTDKMITQFKEAIDQNPDAICLMGHPGEESLAPLIDEAERKGIIVTVQNVDLPNIRQKYTSEGMGYVGQNVYGAGYILGAGAAKKYSLKAGDEVLVLGFFNKVGALAVRAERTTGIVDALKKAGVTVDTVDVPDNVAADYTSDVSYQWFSEQVNKYPKIKVLLVDHNGGVTPAVAAHLKKMGKKPNELPYGGFDLSPETIQYIKEGYIGLVSDQQPFLQGYLPILQACLTKQDNFAGLYIDTGVGLIDDSNVDAVSKLSAEKIR
jgi:simple sugar transport system substrate-binding protein